MPADSSSTRSATTRLRSIVGAALLATLGCEVADFDVERHGTAVIPHEGPSEAFELMELDGLEIVLAEIEDTEDIGREDISHADLRQLTLEVLDPAGSDLAFVDRIEIFAESDDLQRVRVAHRDHLPRNASSVDLEIDDVDLRDYIAAPTVTLVAVVDGSSPPTDVRVKATARLNIGATLRGACDHGR
jgi:hypothetical protein